jgi:hypothetical protein
LAIVFVLIQVAAIILLLIFAILAAFNAWTVINFLLTRRRASAIPLIGGVAGAIATQLLPAHHVQSLWWLPLLADYGSVPILAHFFLQQLLASLKRES